MNEAIDVVITWVDGNDPLHARKILPYLARFNGEAPEDLAGNTRFRSVGEIRYCVASILKFAPFIRKIFIVTDGQDPQVDDLIPRYFPNAITSISIIDHADLFVGMEEVLPVFNSLSIESCLFKLTDLSEQFVYFNDDLFLLREVQPQDWFVGSAPVVYGKWRSVAMDSFLRWLKPKRKGVKPFGFKDSMLNAARCLGVKGSYYCIDHTPHALRKSLLSDFFSANTELLFANVKHRFRDYSQFNPQALHALLAAQRELLVEGSGRTLLYMKPVGRAEGYVERKLRYADAHAEVLFACIGSLDMAEEADCKRIIDWLAAKCGIDVQS